MNIAKLLQQIMTKSKEYAEVTTYSDIFASEPYIPMLFKRDTVH